MPFVGEVDGAWATVMAAGIVMLLLWTGRYGRIEKILIPMVMAFTLTTVVCAVMMQTTEFRVTPENIVTGFQFHFPIEHLVLAIGMYGATGVASSEIAATATGASKRAIRASLAAITTIPVGWREPRVGFGSCRSMSG